MAMQRIEGLFAGTVFKSNSTLYLKLADTSHDHFEGMVANLSNGSTVHWSMLANFGTKVEIVNIGELK